MNKQEVAQKYGVPMPETCKKLDWQNETVFKWYIDLATNQFMLCKEHSESLGLTFYSHAPQMHEIAPILKPKDHIGLWYDLFFKNDGVVNYHYAQIYAELYLVLKEKEQYK